MKAWAIVFGVILGIFVIAIGIGGLFAVVAATASIWAGSTIDHAADVAFRFFKYGFDFIYVASAFGAGYLFGICREATA